MASSVMSMVPFWFLNCVSYSESAADRIGEDGGVQDILAALRAFPNNGGIVTNCCGALWSLAVNGQLYKDVSILLSIACGEYRDKCKDSD